MADSLIGTRLGKYEIHAEIGRGGMGAVYQGYDRSLDRWVAVKVLAPHLIWEKGFVERFLLEARAAARLRHPAIVTIHDVGQEGNWYYFVMEHLEGQSLTEVIGQRGPMPVTEALGILRPLAEALDYAHEQGLVHRDVKPSNVIMDPRGRVTLTDFGIVRAAEGTRLTTTGALIGTPAYMSPEQAQGETVGPPTDQYALGVMAYEMLAGQTPFRSDSTPALLHQVVYEQPPSLQTTRPDLPAGVTKVLDRVLAKEARTRYESCQAFVRALEGAVQATQAARPAAPPAPPELRPLPAAPAQARPSRQGIPGWVWAAGAAVVALCIVGGIVAAGLLAGSRSDRSSENEADTSATLAAQLTANARGVTPEATIPQPADTPLPPTAEPTPTEQAAPTATMVPPATETSSPTEPPSPTATLPPTEAPSMEEREADVLSGLRYREGNGEPIFAYYVDTPPKINGRLGDWTGRAYDIPHSAHDPEGSWSGRSDLYGQFHIGWDLDNLYLGVEVSDDIHVQVEGGRQLYQGDDVEIQIDADLAGDYSDSILDSDDGQVGLSAGDFGSRGPEAYIWLPANREQAGTMIAMAAQQTGGGYTLEAAIPWWVLGGRPAVETAVGLCISLGDNDLPGTAQQQTMISTAPARMWGDPTTWGTLILVDWR